MSSLASADSSLPAVAAPGADSAAAPILDTRSDVPMDDAAASTPASEAARPKRKLDKQAKRAASKAAKKLKRAEYVRQQYHDSTASSSASIAAPTAASVAAHPHGTLKRQGQVTSESVRETEYFFVNGFRIPYAYWFEFSTYAKRRWLGRGLVDVLKGEYGNGGKGADACTSEYYRAAVESGAFRISGARVSPSYVVRDGDRFQHYLHRHETPVSGAPLLVRYEDSRMLLVDKPSSIPVHPCGNYRHNTVIYILAHERPALRSLFVVHRLDAVTSGLLLLAKDAHTARTLSQHISDKEVRKEYVARVQGHFPEQWKDHVLSAPIYQYTHDGRTLLSTSRPVLDAAALAAAAAEALSRPGAQQPPQEKKESVTVFTFLAYDAVTNTSIVKCCPLTGRTHQIRLHLQHLGYPIANDVRYGGRDTSSSQTNDLAAISASMAGAGTEAASTAAPFTPAVYWQDPAARKQQLATESDAEHQLRIRAESVDRSGGCPICVEAQGGSSTSSSAAATAAATSSPAPGCAPVLPSPSPSPGLDADDLSSTPFSSTRVRVEFIWLHAYKYAYDPAFKRSCGDDGTAATAAGAIASVQGTDDDVTNGEHAPVASASASSASAAPTTARWSYEIPWPGWALEIAPEEMKKQHQEVRVHSAADVSSAIATKEAAATQLATAVEAEAQDDEE